MSIKTCEGCDHWEPIGDLGPSSHANNTGWCNAIRAGVALAPPVGKAQIDGGEAESCRLQTHADFGCVLLQGLGT